jgi:hypothetical protein
MEDARTGVSSRLAQDAVGDVTVICVAAASVPAFDYDLGVLFRPDRHVIVAVVDSVWTSDHYTNLGQIVDEIWCWDGGTAERLRGVCDVHTENLPYPTGDTGPAHKGCELVCWADLNEPGHPDAVLSRVSSFVGDQQQPRQLELYVSGWEANPPLFETLHGLGRSCEHLSVHRVTSWQEAIEHAGSLLPLGSGFGPVEAEALRVGVDLIHPGEPSLRDWTAETTSFGVAAVDRVALVRRSRD